MQETKAGTSTEQQGDVRHRELDLIRSVLFTYLEEGKSVSSWRLPGQAEKNVIICSQVISIDADQFSVEDSQPGFSYLPLRQERAEIISPGRHSS